MKIKVESITPVKHRITISVDADRVRQSRDSLYKKLRKQVQIRGFRPGKAPRSLMERHYGDQVNEKIRNDLLEEALKKAVEENKLRIVTQPEIESGVFEEDGTFSAAATVEVVPEIEPAGYEDVATKRQKVAVTDEAVQERLDQLAQMRSMVKTIEDHREV